MNPVKRAAVVAAAMVLAQGSLLSCQLVIPCNTRDLSISQRFGGVANGGGIVYNYILTNQGRRPCTVSGYPAAIALGKDRMPVDKIEFERSLGAAAGPADQHVRLIPLDPGSHAWFQVMSYDCMGCYNAEQFSLCKKARLIRITPPGNRRPFPPLAFETCTANPKISFLLPGLPPG